MRQSRFSRWQPGGARIARTSCCGRYDTTLRRLSRAGTAKLSPTRAARAWCPTSAPIACRGGYQPPRRAGGFFLLSFNDIKFCTGVGSVQRSREKGRRENAQSRVCRRRSSEVLARTAQFLGASAPHPRAENVRQGRNGGGDGPVVQPSLGHHVTFSRAVIYKAGAFRCR